MQTNAAQGLFDPAYERDSCGFGLIASLDDQPSHWIVRTAITSLNRLTHRGAVAADGKTGDGCGLLLKKPRAFLEAIAQQAGIELAERFAVGCVFLSTFDDQADRARSALEAQLRREELEVAGWRLVPTDADACGDEALKTLPRIEQLFVNCRLDIDEAAFNRKLFLARRRAEKALERKDPVFYVPSLSASTMVYKGMVMPQHLAQFYPDLKDERSRPRSWCSTSASRPTPCRNGGSRTRSAFSRTTAKSTPSRRNRNWAAARGPLFRSPLLPDLSDILPLVSMSGSDSQSLDNMLEVLLMGGIDALHAMRLLMPPAWQTRR